jgi:hypothetical protein
MLADGGDLVGIEAAHGDAILERDHRGTETGPPS